MSAFRHRPCPLRVVKRPSADGRLPATTGHSGDLIVMWLYGTLALEIHKQEPRRSRICVVLLSTIKRRQASMRLRNSSASNSCFTGKSSTARQKPAASYISGTGGRAAKRASARKGSSAASTCRLRVEVNRVAEGVKYHGPMRAEAGWPPTLNRLPVSLTSVPLTFRIEKS